MTSGASHKRKIHLKSFDFEFNQLTTNWEDVTCPICLDFPHNGVLLQCTSLEKGCRSFICDTDHTHSNCLDRFKLANGVPIVTKVILSSDTSPLGSTVVVTIDTEVRPLCPLCRGEVTGWVIVDQARGYLNMKERFCEEEKCAFVGNYFELQKHAKLKHPHAQPSKIDPARQLDWENFQQSSEVIDVLSTIESEIPHGVVYGDYVIEYVDDGIENEPEGFRRAGRNRRTSCIFYRVLERLRAFRNRQRSRGRERRGRRHTRRDVSNSDVSSVNSADIAVYTVDEVGFVGRDVALNGSSSHRSSRRHHSHLRGR